ncbi:MAG: hypothetical protein Q9222_001825 [Ikaeria aurantiellina]
MAKYEKVDDGSAPWFAIPSVPVVGIEHPCMLTDAGRAVDSLGGQSKLGEVEPLSSHSGKAVLLFSADRRQLRLSSFNTKTSNILVKITVPKRTRRKRRNAPFEVSDQPAPEPGLLSRPEDTRHLVRSMRDNLDEYQVEALGFIGQTHRFRRLPDFVWSSGQSPFMSKMKDYILPFQYQDLKNFKFDMSKGAREDHDIIPPPRWTAHRIPFNYSYRQNPIVPQIFAPTDPSAKSISQRPQLNKIPMLSHDMQSIPTEPPDGLPAEDTLPATFRALIEAVRKLFIDRPICTRRVLQNLLPADLWKAVGPNAAKYLWQYVAYLWISGPWRDSICALGVDPRKDKALRCYQTVMFQLEPEPMDTRLDKAKVTKTRADRKLALQGKNRESHIFDGSTVGLDGKLWQVCDVTDPFLRSLLETETLRDECHEASDGWYPNGIWAKIRIIMRTKLGSILAGEVVGPEQDQEFLRLHEQIPDVVTAENRSQAVFEKGSLPKHVMKLAEQIRSMATKQLTGGSGALDLDGVKKQTRRRPGGGARGRVTYMGSRGGRPRKSGPRGARPDARTQNNHKVDTLDPRLRDATDALVEMERDMIMKAFEDDIDGADDGRGDIEDREVGEDKDEINAEDYDDVDVDVDEDEDVVEDEDEDEEDDNAEDDNAEASGLSAIEEGTDDLMEVNDAGEEDETMLSD